MTVPRFRISRYWLVVILLILAPISRAQQPGGTTQVTGVVKDPIGNLYTNSQISFIFYDPGTSGKLPLLNGSTFQQTFTGYATDSFGNIPSGVYLPDNGLIAGSSGATGTQWIVKVCYSDRVTCFSSNLTIDCAGNHPATCTGSAINLTAVLQAVAAPIPGSPINNSPPVWLNTLYIGGAAASNWGGGDIGAQANAAYASLPATGGAIRVLPSLTGAAYQYTTPIVFATSGKYVDFGGMGVGNALLGSAVTNIPGGTVLQFTPTTGNAITLDYVPIGAAAWNGRHGVNNLTIVSNQLTLYGGTIAIPNTSTSMGIRVGDTNWGCLGASFYNLDLRGFNTNFYVKNQISWGLAFYNLTSMFSKHGMHIQDIEQVTIINPKLIYNLTAMEVSSEVTIVGGSIDQNGGEVSGGGQTTTTSPALVDIVGEVFGPDVMLVGTHFEQGQAGFTNPMQYVNFINGKISISGGSGIDDLASGAAQNWVVSPIITMDGGFNAFSAGRAGFIATTTIVGMVSVFNASPTHLIASAGANLTDTSVNLTGPNTAKTFYGAVNSSVGFQIAGGAVLGAYATGTWTPVPTSLTHTGAAPTITGTYTQVGKMVNWTIQIVAGTSTSSTAGVTTFTLPPPGVPSLNAGFAFTGTDLLSFTGGGVLDTGGIHTPTWTTVTSPVYLSGSYTVN